MKGKNWPVLLEGTLDMISLYIYGLLCMHYICIYDTYIYILCIHASTFKVQFTCNMSDVCITYNIYIYIII